MRFGLNIALPANRLSLDGLLAQIRQAEAGGLASVWLPNAAGFDALTVLALAGRETERVELGTFVVPTYPRHPVALAQQALTVQAATGNRLTLAIGLSHRHVVEDALGLDFDRPAAHMREYLTVLRGLLAGEPVDFVGERYRVHSRVQVTGAEPPSVLAAALAPAILRLCGRLADGTVTWMGGLPYLRDFAVPLLRRAAAEAGRSAPRVVAGVPVCVTDEPAEARAHAERSFAHYATTPVYRAVLDRGGAAGPGDVAVVGTEAEVADQIAAYAAAGVTDFNAAIFGPSATRPGAWELLTALARQPA